MKRFHVHIAVESIDQSVSFYNTLFGQQPTVSQADYAKWMLDDPRVNFAISQRPARAGHSGLDHLGFQLDSVPELHAMTTQLQAAGVAVTGQGETTCCYAKSDKGWVHDPQGIAWESFVTLGQATTYGAENASDEQAGSACCAPSATETAPMQTASLAAAAKPKISLKDIPVSCASTAPAVAGKSCC
jgi:catechol 2,3-dioxygenase-like lactoylglutathione lyase family enzyme